MTSCSQCGHSNPDDARFCSNCGAALRPASAAAPSPGETSTITIGSAIESGEPDKGDGFTAADQAAIDALPAGSALLVVRRGPNSGSRFLLDSDTTTAGRHPESDIFLDDVTVSRRHAEFLRAVDGFAVRDVGSLNGTYVNRQRIDSSPLSAGDEVQVGKYRLVYYPSPSAGGGAA
jgi:pSer/pThr/pTyr-binding forkhead associated (FHA) protein